jgi:hypothetical protein
VSIIEIFNDILLIYFLSTVSVSKKLTQTSIMA